MDKAQPAQSGSAQAQPAQSGPAPAQPAGQQFRLGLVGAGRMGRTHLDALAGSGSVRIAGVADPSPDSRAAVAEAGVQAHASLPDLLAAQPLDGLLIAAPTSHHLALVSEALGAGLPVLCEKPCGLTVAEAARCAEEAQRAGLLLQVAYWRRYVPELIALRDQIARGNLGKILAVNCYQWDEAPPPAVFRESSGGIFVDMGVHEFDQVRWLTGQEFGVVWPAASRTAGAPGDPDCAQLVAELDGGSTALVSLGRWHPDGDICRVEVYGTSGSLSCPFLRPADAGQVFALALRNQAEDFARAALAGQVSSGAGIADAVVALTLARTAADLLVTAEQH
ncbi:MAG TPA: Gfo/Idh/MocA family oxidoreductase [Streptosporangiaceae bacterium]|nr:Gfo/Idh/MocA family oxidoreductase [Streptosporangiaceae bacterium]